MDNVKKELTQKGLGCIFSLVNKEFAKKADKSDVTALETHLEQVERTVANILNEFDIKYNK